MAEPRSTARWTSATHIGRPADASTLTTRYRSEVKVLIQLVLEASALFSRGVLAKTARQ
jgi:hypothetical protein